MDQDLPSSIIGLSLKDKPDKFKGGEMSIATLVAAKRCATKMKRRSSLFSIEKTMLDTGTAVVSHADFPRPRSKSLPARKVSSPALRFSKEMLTEMIKDVLEEEMKGKEYNEKDCAEQTHLLVAAMKSQITRMNIPNFKFICTCHLTRRMDQYPMSIESGCAWDETKTSVEKDIFAEKVYKSENILAIGSVYGIYTSDFNNLHAIKAIRAQKSLSFAIRKTSNEEENDYFED